MTYYLDTNIISYVLKGNEAIKAQIAGKLWQGDTVSIPSVAYYEVKRGLLVNTATSKMDRFMRLVEKLGIVELTAATLEKAAQIYADLTKRRQIIEDDDIFIGATALEHNAVLVTNNERHMGRIAGLRIEVWS